MLTTDYIIITIPMHTLEGTQVTAMDMAAGLVTEEDMVTVMDMATVATAATAATVAMVATAMLIMEAMVSPKILIVTMQDTVGTIWAGSPSTIEGTTEIMLLPRLRTKLTLLTSLQ